MPVYTSGAAQARITQRRGDGAQNANGGGYWRADNGISTPAPQRVAFIQTPAVAAAIDYFDTVTGGFVMAGPIAESASGSVATSGGFTLAGSIAAAALYGDVRSGGFTIGGTLVEGKLATDVRTGGFIFGGFGSEGAGGSGSPSGGFGLGGLRAESAAFADAPTGGFLLGGLETETYVPPPPVSSGLIDLLTPQRQRPRTYRDWPKGGFALTGSVEEEQIHDAIVTGTLTRRRVVKPERSFEDELAELLELELV